ncbi:MAG: hypothetical protein KBD67_06795 [Anaerolineaceae bacterium]|nr:hypothetical protein [Anaerolineaceae bacterium]
MKALRFISVFLVFIMLAGSTISVAAQNYIFQVPEKAVVVTINVDGSISIDYTMTFLNDAAAHEIDIVDIGLPNYYYDLRAITGDINGIPIKKITESDIVSPGISLYLQENTIPPGGEGTVHVFIPSVANAVYPSSAEESEAYGSMVFYPHYYYPENCYGNTNYQMTILLPPGVSESEGRYYPPQNWPGESEPESMLMDDGRIFYTWVSDQADSCTEYSFGASFPARLLNDGVIVTEPYVPPSEENRPSSSNLSEFICPLIFCFGFALFIGLSIYSVIKGNEKRKLKYLPPKILIEGNGIKRGLTAVEAAVLKEQPMDKIFTMILFSVIKKGAAEVISSDPLDIKPDDPLPENLYAYESEFLEAFKLTAIDRKKALQTTMVNLIKSVTEKMKGFSRKETLEYYDQIMNKAWQQVQEAATPEVKAQVYEEVMDWTMLDKKYEDKTQEVFSGPVLMPTPSWWWRYDPAIPRPSVTPASTSVKPAGIPAGQSVGTPPSLSMPKIPGSAFAASMVNSVSKFSSNVLGGLPGFSSGVTNVTNPPPPPSTYRSSGSGGGGGGHSCACACACAGCACACAGGGR